jgi:hypothetical protein
VKTNQTHRNKKMSQYSKYKKIFANIYFKHIGMSRSSSPDKALGLDGFTARFLQAAWDIIRVDLMNAFDSFWNLDTRSFHAINKTVMVLLPKLSEAVAIKDFGLISLIHVLGKLFSKVLANQLGPRLGKLIHVCQN